MDIGEPMLAEDVSAWLDVPRLICVLERLVTMLDESDVLDIAEVALLLNMSDEVPDD